MKQRKVTFKMYPNPAQKKLLSDVLGVHQRLYNKALEQKKSLYEKEQVNISWYEQSAYLTKWRAEDKTLAAVNAQSEQVTLKRLHLAFAAFFRRLKAGEKPGFPRFKSYARYPGWGYATHGDGWTLISPNLKHGQVRLSKMGKIKLRGQAGTLGIPKTAEVLHKSGQWFLSVTLNGEPKRTAGKAAVGLDWGVENFATLANHQGQIETIANPRLGQQKAKPIKACQQQIARAKKGSKNRRALILSLGKHYRHLANQRKEFIHQTSAKIVRQSALIASEELSIKNMRPKGGVFKKALNREILNTSAAALIATLKYKAEEAGIQWVEVPTRQVKPSQTCHGCGVQVKKALSERRHICPCGKTCFCHENASLVMLNWALTGCSNESGTGCAVERGIHLAVKQETPSIISA